MVTCAAASQGAVGATQAASSRLGAFAPEASISSTKAAPHKALAAFSSVAQASGLSAEQGAQAPQAVAKSSLPNEGPSSIVHLSAAGKLAASTASAGSHATPTHPQATQDPMMKQLDQMVAAMVLLLALDAQKHHGAASFALGMLAASLSVQGAQGAAASSASGAAPQGLAAAALA